MARRTDFAVKRLGTISVVVLLIVMAAAFNLQKFPGFAGTGYHADFKDASGLHKGNIVQVAGVKVGRVNNIHISGDHVTVDFDAKNADLGTRTQASIEVLNLLGEKYLEIKPEGGGKMKGGDTIPTTRTSAGYDIVSTLGELTQRTEKIDTAQLAQSLTTLGDTLNAASPHIKSTFSGLTRISQTIASRDQGLQQLLQHASSVTKLLAERRGDLITLMKQGDLVFKELIARRDAIHSLLVNARQLAVVLRGVAADNQKQIGPALAELHTAVGFLQQRKQLLQRTIHNLGPYASILINVIGTGPWFDAYVPNFSGIASGEFKSGPR